MRSTYAAALLICSVPAIQAADKENPFKNAEVGDWVAYKMTGLTDAKSKMTVVAKDDKQATYELATTFTAGGKEVTAPVRTLRVDLTKPYDPLAAANLQQNNVKVETLGEGKEKIKLGDKEFDTRWTKMKTTSKVNNMTVQAEFKMWFSDDVPLSGLVKMEETNVFKIGEKTSTVTNSLELIGSGRNGRK
jgi:hypothetical protein